MKRIGVAAAVCVLTVLALAQEKPVPITSEAHHQLVLENECTRVFHVVIAPKESTLMHQHDLDYVFVQIGAADISNEKAGAAAAEVKFADGTVRFAKGGFAHKVTNLLDTPFVNLTIEVKKPSTKSLCAAAWPGVAAEKPEGCGATITTGSSGQTYNLGTDAVEAHTWFTTGNGTSVTPDDAEYPRLLVALTPLRCNCGGAQTKEMKPGDVAWVPKGTLAEVSKSGDAGARFVMVSFK